VFPSGQLGRGKTYLPKKMVITVNLISHWSIIAVLNAGMINADLVEDESEEPYDLEVRALIFLDSLKLRDGAVIARNIRTWLNHEWDKKYSLIGFRIFNEHLCSYLNLKVRI
jgi:hypothetical protein